MEIKEPIYWGGFTKHQVIKFARKQAANWFASISEKEFDTFVSWARLTGVYSPDKDKTWDAFRGYCIGLRQNKKP